MKSIVSGTIILRWEAEDPERQPLSFRILSSSDGGNSFSPVDSVSNVRQFVLDTRRIPNSYTTAIRLEAYDGALTSYSQSMVLALLNEYKQIKDSAITHLSGSGTGILRPLAVDSTLLTGHTYRVTFDSVSGALRYSVTDMNTNRVRIAGEALSSIVGGGTFCDGFRLGIQSDKLEIDSAGSGFINAPNTNFSTRVINPTIGIVRLVPIDAKFVFNAMDTTIDGKYLFPGDTALNGSLQKKIATPFRILALANDAPLEAVIFEKNINGKWDPGEEIFVRTPIQYRTSVANTSLEVIFNPPSNPNLKLAIRGGEIFIARMKKPFTTADIFEFVVGPSNLGPTRVKDQSGRVSLFALDQNYPNPFNPGTWIRFSLSQKASTLLRVYDIGGREVRTILDGPLDGGIHAIRWDGRDNNSFPVASGVYFYRLRSGSHVSTKKMVLLR